MKKIEGKNKNGKSYKKLGFSLIGLAICLMAIIALVKFGTILFLLPVWSWISHIIVNATGLNIWLAKALSALLILPLIYVASLIFSWKKRKRKVGIILLSATTAIICLGMFFITKDTYFSFKSGEATKWYIITPQGEYKFSSSHGYDPIWGEEYKIVTPQVVEDYIRQQQGEVYSTLPQDQYFDIKTGKAVKWYAVLPDSSIEVFSHSGVHPKYGVELKPVTEEIVVKLMKGEIELKEIKIEREKEKVRKEKERTREELSQLEDSVKLAQQELSVVESQRDRLIEERVLTIAKAPEVRKKIRPPPKKEVKNEGRPYLGVSYKYVDEISIKLPVDYGVVVLSKLRLGEVAVKPGSPADKAGIEEGDIILELNNTKLSRKYDLANEINKLSPGDKIRLKFLRLSESTKKRLIEIELGSLKK